MATATEFDLTFAGVPFVSDAAPIPMVPMGEHVRSIGKPFRPLPDLMDEIDRILPFRFLNDFKSPSTYPGRNLGAVAYQEQIGPNPNSTLKLGEWYYPTGASRWSVFRALATSSQAKEMLAETTGTSSGTFVFKFVPVSPDNVASSFYSLSTSMFMLPPRTLGENGIVEDGLYLITLVDERYYWQYEPVTLHITKDSTWSSVIDEIAETLGITLDYDTPADVYGKPEPDSQLWTNSESAATLFDAVAANVGTVVVRKLDGTYALETPTSSVTLVVANRGSAQNVVRMAGGDLFNSGSLMKAGDLRNTRNAVVPETVRVSFPKYVMGPVPHFLNSRYAPQRPSAWYEQSYGDVFEVNVPLASGSVFASGLSGYGTHTLHSTAKAMISGEADADLSGLNYSGLTNLAMQLASDYTGWQVGSALDEVYPGSYAWTPEGFHDILWSWKPREGLATTRVIRAEWNQAVREFQHSAVALSGSTNVPAGVGGLSVPLTVRDAEAASVTTTLAATLLSGDYSATFTAASTFPRNNRWRGTINNERILFEGTSGGTAVGIVYRGIDGTIQTEQANASTITQTVPNTTYGVNLITVGSGLRVFPQAWTSGGVQESRLELISGFTTGGGGAPVFAGVRLTKSATQSISSATPTAITFDGETFDTAAYHSTVSNTSRITIPTDEEGFYHIGMHGSWDQFAFETPTTSAIIRLNGTTTLSSTRQVIENGVDPTPVDFTLNTIYELAVTDYIEVVVEHDGGAGDGDILNTTQFWAYKVGI